MMTITHYRTKPYMSKSELTEMMALFAKVGEAPGTVAHYVDASGGGGWIVGNSDDPAANYANIIRYEPYLVLETTIVMPIDDAVPAILEALA